MTRLYEKRTLTNEQAIAICLDKRIQEDIAKDYDISRVQVSRIQNGHRYANVTEHVRDKKAFAVRLSDLRYKHQDLVRQTERVAKEITELEELESSRPDETKRQEDLVRYREALGRL